MERIIESDVIIKKAYEELNRFNWSEKEFMAYEQEIKRIRDKKAVFAQKLDDARDESIQISKERGIKIGAEKGKIEVAKNLLKAGVSVDLITESTGLPKTEIAQLKEEVTS